MRNYNIEMWKYTKELKVKSENPKLGFYHKPSSESILQSVKIRTNSFGLRGKEILKEKSVNRRVLFLGSSATLGWGVKEENTMISLLNKRMVSDVRDDKRLSLCDTEKNLEGIEKLKQKRSEIPAVTHIDYSARVQTVDKNTNKRYYHLLSKFDSLTSCPILVNTSFNVRGEPIVCSPKDSYICFMRTGIDILVLEDFILYKTEQDANDYDDNWKETFELD